VNSTIIFKYLKVMVFIFIFLLYFKSILEKNGYSISNIIIFNPLELRMYVCVALVYECTMGLYIMRIILSNEEMELVMKLIYYQDVKVDHRLTVGFQKMVEHSLTAKLNRVVNYSTYTYLYLTNVNLDW
ncbi:hypothetical protein L9F63_018218, partial [Diploptera punctata]